MSSNVRTDCFFNLSTEERIDLFKRRQSLRLDNIYRHYYGWMMLPLALLGALLTTLFLVTTYKAIKGRRVSRKCYILLFNRAIGDLLSCVVALGTVGYTLTTSEVNRDVVFCLESFFIGSFWSAMVSYVALSLLKLYAVWKPFDYRKTVTMKRCLYLIVLSWIFFLIISAVTLGVTALVKVPALNEWSGCKMETCLRRMYLARNFVTICVYFLTLIVFTMTVLLIRRAQRFNDSFRNKSRDSNSSEGGRAGGRARFPLWKLALNVATFAGLYIFYVIWCVGLLLNRDQCFFQRNYAEMMRLLGFVRATLVLRICVDPILSFITDFQLRKIFLQWAGINRRISFIHSSETMKKANYSEDNSSEGASTSTQTTHTAGAGGIERINRAQTVKSVC